jgi:hypothetical protein
MCLPQGFLSGRRFAIGFFGRFSTKAIGSLIKIILSMAFMSGCMVEYPMCLLNILDKVHNSKMIHRSTYLMVWLTDGEWGMQGHFQGPPNVLPPTSWPNPSHQGQNSTPRSGGTQSGTVGGSRPTGGRQQQSNNIRHPCHKALMDPYLGINSNRINISLLEVLNKKYEDLPMIPNYITQQGRIAICWN